MLLVRYTKQLTKGTAKCFSAVSVLDPAFGEKKPYVNKIPYEIHRNYINTKEKSPFLAINLLVDKKATVVGDVALGTRTVIGCNSIIRGDLNEILIGGRCIIEDHVTIMAEAKLDGAVNTAVEIGGFTRIEKRSILHSCKIGFHSRIGAHSTISEGVLIGENCYVLPGSCVIPNTVILDNQVWGGNPAKFIRNIEADEIAENDKIIEELEEKAMKQHKMYTYDSEAYAHIYDEKMHNPKRSIYRQFWEETHGMSIEERKKGLPDYIRSKM